MHPKNLAINQDDILVINGEQQSEARDLWQEQIVDLSGFEERVQIRFRAISGGYGINEIDLDDISVVEMPSCPNPSNFEISNITYESSLLLFPKTMSIIETFLRIFNAFSSPIPCN